MCLAYRTVIHAALKLAVALLATVWVTGAQAGLIPVNTFLEFGFSDAGISATGCDPDDPVGPFCIPSSGTPTEFLDAPPWTFTTTTASTLTVTDAFESGDRFEVLDFGVVVGHTSFPVGVGDCGDDPVDCLADPNMSKASFALLAGPHSLTLTPTTQGGGAGYLFVAAVPEPGTLSLALLVGFTAAGFARRKRSGQ